MRFYTFEKLEKLVSFDDDNLENFVLYDLFERTIYNNISLEKSLYITNVDDICRADKVCSNIYQGDLSYIEELLVTNDILNPFSIEDKQELFYVIDLDKIENMHTSEYNIDSSNKFKILNINKNKRSNNVELPPSVNPGLKQIDIDYEKRKITILNKFK